MATRTSSKTGAAKAAPAKSKLTKKEEALLEFLAEVAGSTGQDDAFNRFVARYKGAKHV